MTSRILDRFERPFDIDAEPATNGHANGSANGHAPAHAKGAAFDSLIRSLSNLENLTPAQRAREPMKNHTWSFVAAFAIAKSAPPFGIFSETESEIERRREKAFRRGDRLWVPRRGARRTAVERWLRLSPAKLSTWRTWQSKAIELDAEHPLAMLFKRPNPMHGPRQFWMTTLMMLAHKGDARWVLRGPEFQPLGSSSIPAQIWPALPSSMRAIQQDGSGELVAWEFTIPNGLPGGGGGRKLRLEPHEVIRFHFPDPEDYLGAIAPVAAAAAAIERDMLADTANRDLIQNDCTPKGVVQSDLPFDADAEKEFKTKWEGRHKRGTGGAGRTAFLYGGTKYIPVGMSPEEMGFRDLYELDRIATLAAFGAPPSAVGLSEAANYATDLAQRLGFYSNTVLPFLGLIEETLDATLFLTEADTHFGMFDRSMIEALRAGISEKAMTAKTLAGPELHVPPKLSLSMAGLEVEDFVGDDVALVSPMLAPAKEVTSGELLPDPNAPKPGAIPPAGEDPGESPTEPTPIGDGTKEPKPAAGGAGEDEVKGRVVAAIVRGAVLSERVRVDRPALRSMIACGMSIELDEAERELRAYSRKQSRWAHLRGRERKAASAKRHLEFLKLQGALEDRVSSKYRAWVREVREATLRRFDREAKGNLPALIRAFAKAEADEVEKLDLGAILPDFGESKSSLSATTRPTFSDAIGEVYDFTFDDIGGVPIFEVDDRRIVSFFDARHDRFTGMTTQRLIDRVRENLSQGMAKGETVQELRLRLGESLDMAASSAKTLQVARTETAGFANGMRNEMFVADGWKVATWDSAGDEAVRDSHVIFGDSGPQPMGFNFLTLVNATDGFLGYPGDSRGPAREIINCRCFHLPES